MASVVAAAEVAWADDLEKDLCNLLNQAGIHCSCRYYGAGLSKNVVSPGLA